MPHPQGIPQKRVVVWTYQTFLGSMITGTALLLSLAAVVCAGSFVENGERAEEIGLLWWYSVPAMAVCGVLSAFVSPWYRAPAGILRWALRFIAVAVSVAGSGVLVTWLFLKLAY